MTSSWQKQTNNKCGLLVANSNILEILKRFLTDDGVDVLGRVLSKSADAGTFSWHSKAGKWPLAVHILTNHRAHLPNTSQSVWGKGTNVNQWDPSQRSRGKEKCWSYAERRFSLVSLSAKMWTVPLSLEAHRKEESWLKLMLDRANKADKKDLERANTSLSGGH